MRKRMVLLGSVVPFLAGGCGGLPGDYDPAFEGSASNADQVGQTSQAVDVGNWALGGNTLTETGRLGSNSNHAVEIKVNNLRALRIEPATVPNLIGGDTANAVTPGVTGAAIAGGGWPGGGFPNKVTDDAGFVGGGWQNQAGDNAGSTGNASAATVGGGYKNTASAMRATVGGGYLNKASGAFATVTGGQQNEATAENATVSGGSTNVATAIHTTIGGGTNNRATNLGVTIGGGKDNGASGTYNTVGGGEGNGASEQHSTVAGGLNNQAVAPHSFVGGGLDNLVGQSRGTVCGGARNQTHGQSGAIGGGHDNIVRGDGGTIGGGEFNSAGVEQLIYSYATVAGGSTNTASGVASAVGGGKENAALGANATIPGGFKNGAFGTNSFAAGKEAIADQNGCFVWGDNSAGSVTCGGANRWKTKATGGYYLYTDNTLQHVAVYTQQTSSWQYPSDRNAKQNVVSVRGADVLAKLASVPVSTWSYKADATHTKHMGPMAQDFHAAFKLGNSDRAIDTGDIVGVSLAAIKGLNEKVERLEADNFELVRRLDRLERQPSAHASMFGSREFGLAGLACALLGIWIGRRKRRGESILPA
jgi:trimeric autotransporter adhesin